VADAAVAVDIYKPLDILADVASQIAFDIIAFLDERSQATHFVFDKIPDASIRIDACAL
jgi:hypothetical protein